jgi:hypothetical protein
MTAILERLIAVRQIVAGQSANSRRSMSTRRSPFLKSVSFAK